MDTILIGVGVFTQLFILFAIYKTLDEIKDFIKDKLNGNI